MNLWDWLNGWRKHKSDYIEKAVLRRGEDDIKTYLNGTTLMLKYKKKKVVFTAAHWNNYETYEDYIQRHVDIVLGLRKDPLL